MIPLRRRSAIADRGQTTRRGRRIETPKDKPGLRANACLGSLAVKRVLGKDETPDSNSGLGFQYFLQSQRIRRRDIYPEPDVFLGASADTLPVLSKWIDFSLNMIA